MRAILVALALTVAIAGRAHADLDALVWLDPPEPVPGAVFQDADGSPVTLGDFAGRAVLLNFWATWCAPCRREMPSLDALQARLGGPDFVVLAVSEDRGGMADAKPFFEELGLRNLAVYADPAMELGRAFKLVGLPATYIIDHEGRVLARLLGDAEWDGEAAIAILEPVIAAAREARVSVDTTEAPCSCGGPKAARVAAHGSVAPPPEE